MTGRSLSSRMALFALLQGCSFADAATVVNSCESNASCGAGEVCDRDLRACVSRGSADYEVVLRVTAPATENAFASPPTRFGPFPIQGSVNSRTLTVRETNVVRGLVAVEGGDGDRRPVSAELLFTPTGVPEGPGAETLSVMTTLEANGDAPTNFALGLRLDTSYDVQVLPSTEEAARVPPRRFSLPAEDIASGRVELVYDSLQPVVGNLISAEGTVQPDVAVRAVQPETGQVISSRAVTGELGEFELQVDTSQQGADVPWLIETRPSTALPWYCAWRSEARDINFGPDRAVVTLPAFPPAVSIEVAVEHAPEELVISEVVDAQVTFTGELTVERGDESETTCVCTRTGRTDQSGLLRVDLLQGDYQVVATPPSERTRLAPTLVSDLAVLPQASGGTQRGVTFLVPERTRVQGTVLDASGRPLPGVTVRGVPLEPDDELPGVAAYNRSASTLTDVNGDYALALDTGLYDLVFEPADGTSYPWHLRVAERIDSLETRVRDAKLGTAVVLRGEVSFEGDREPGGALVAAFAKVVDGIHGARFVQIGRANVEQDGSYALYLPASLPSR